MSGAEATRGAAAAEGAAAAGGQSGADAAEGAAAPGGMKGADATAAEGMRGGEAMEDRAASGGSPNGATRPGTEDRLARAEALAARIGRLYAAQFSILDDDLWHLAKLSEELGELNAAWLSAHGRGRSRGLTPAELTRAVEDEAADLFGFLLLFAARNDIDLAAALARKWGKYLTPPPAA